MSIAGDIRRNLASARLGRAEIAGSLGDLGTFLPLLVGMAAANGLDFAAGLFFAGLFSVLTGLLFPVPMAVQPMKAIAAVAITEGLTVGQITAAGAIVSGAILVLGLTGLVDALNRLIPRSVVRGLQLALGLALLMKGLRMAADTGVWWAADSYLTAVCAAVVVLSLFESRRVPAALLLFVGGVALTVGTAPALVRELAPGLWMPSIHVPTLDDAISALPRAALPQIPLTTLNSVVAVCALSLDLFPDRPITPRRVATSVGLMNLVGVWFGAMPMCHGAGGLAGQHRFGARSNGSILFLGAVKMGLAVVFGASLMPLATAFPASVLGVMLAFSGLSLAVVVRDQARFADAFVVILTAGACLALNQIAIGFLVGLCAAAILRVAHRPDPAGPGPA